MYRAGLIPRGKRARGVSRGFDSPQVFAAAHFLSRATVLSLAFGLAVFYAVDGITFFDGLKTVCDDDEGLAAVE